VTSSSRLAIRPCNMLQRNHKMTGKDDNSENCNWDVGHGMPFMTITYSRTALQAAANKDAASIG
jgi:hypothetical protein